MENLSYFFLELQEVLPFVLVQLSLVFPDCKFVLSCWKNCNVACEKKEDTWQGSFGMEVHEVMQSEAIH